MSSINPINLPVEPVAPSPRVVRNVSTPVSPGSAPTQAPGSSSQAAIERSRASRPGARVEQVPTAVTTAAALEAPEASRAADQVTREELQAQVNAALARTQTALQFRVDEDAGKLVVSVIEEESGETLLQIPSEVALRIARSLAADGKGLVNEKA